MQSGVWRVGFTDFEEASMRSQDNVHRKTACYSANSDSGIFLLKLYFTDMPATKKTPLQSTALDLSISGSAQPQQHHTWESSGDFAPQFQPMGAKKGGSRYLSCNDKLK